MGYLPGCSQLLLAPPGCSWLLFLLAPPGLEQPGKKEEEPGRGNRSQETSQEAGGKRIQEERGGARKSREEPGGPGYKKEPAGARRSKKEPGDPGGARRRWGEPRGARSRAWGSQGESTGSSWLSQQTLAPPKGPEIYYKAPAWSCWLLLESFCNLLGHPQSSWQLLRALG